MFHHFVAIIKHFNQPVFLFRIFSYSLSVSGTGGGEKGNDSHGALGEVPSVGLLCTNVSSVTTSSVTTATLSNSSVEIATSVPLSSSTVESKYFFI